MPQNSPNAPIDLSDLGGVPVGQVAAPAVPVQPMAQPQAGPQTPGKINLDDLGAIPVGGSASTYRNIAQQAATQATQATQPAEAYKTSPEDLIGATTGFETPASANVVGDVGKGVLKGAGQTVAGVSSLINKIPGVGETLAPKVGTQALSQMSQPTNTAQKIGVGIEQAAEFMLLSETGAEELKALSVADRLTKTAKIASFLESHPVAAKAAIDAASQAAQTFVKRSDLPMGQRALEAGKEGAVMGGMSGAIGAASAGMGKVTDWMRDAGWAGDVVDRAKVLSQYSPSADDVANTLKGSLDAKEVAMHSDFEDAINQVKGAIGTKPINVQGTPLYDAAMKLKTETENLPAGIQAGMRALTPAKENIGKLLDELTTADSGMTGNQLIELRQGLSKSLTKVDPAIKQDVGALLDGIDGTLDRMSENIGDKSVSKVYADARAAYRQTLSDLKEPFVQAIRDGRVSDVLKSVTSSAQNAPYKLGVLKNLVGDDVVDAFGLNRFSDLIKTSTDDLGRINLKKVINGWESIPKSTRDALGDSTYLVDNLVKGMKSLNRSINFVKTGTYLGAAGLAGAGITGVVGGQNKALSTIEIIGSLAMGLQGHYGSGALTEAILNNPKLYTGLGKLAGKDFSGYDTFDPKNIGIQPAPIGAAAKSGIVTHVFNKDTGKVEPVPNSQNRQTRPFYDSEIPDTTQKTDTQNMWNAFPDNQKLADHVIALEGNSDVARRNNNPGNLRFANQPNATLGEGGFARFKDVATGRQALETQLASWRQKHPDWTISQFNMNYAPDATHGGDNPNGTEAHRNAYLATQAARM